MTATPTPPPLAWVALLDPADRETFYTDLAQAVEASRTTDDPGEIERCLRQWKLTTRGMTDASLRDQLLE